MPGVVVEDALGVRLARPRLPRRPAQRELRVREIHAQRARLRVERDHVRVTVRVRIRVSSPSP